MCGIVGYIGNQQAQSILIGALKRLEYRGYDSSGIAIRGRCITTVKDKVRVGELAQMMPELPGTAGIGHTRWATHGEPSRLNAHPHQDCRGKIVAVHNGVITNYQTLKSQLMAEGHVFVSETDTEVIPHLIEKHYRGNLEAATIQAMQELEGSYAMAVMVEGEDKLIAAKKGSPLVIGLGDGENIIASDIPAVLDITKRVIYLQEGDLAVLTAQEVKIVNGGQLAVREVCRIDWNVEDVQKGGHEHFMIKEIHEEPRVIRNTLLEFQHAGIAVSNQRLAQDKNPRRILMLACGTSYHAGLIGKYLIEELTDIPVQVELASEVNHRDRVVRVTNAVAITQSGETADVLMAMRKLKERGSFLSVITNTREGSASRLADESMYIAAGPEVSVAATKSFIGQLIGLYKLALSYPCANIQLHDKIESELNSLPDQVEQILHNDSQIVDCARFLSGFSKAFFVGRGINYPIALEGALKLKEISYIYAEGYAAGEIKHGPFSLLQDDTPVVAIVAQDMTYDSMVTNIREITSRKSPVIAIVNENDTTIQTMVDYVIKVPATMSLLSPVVNSVVLQLLAYYTAKFKDCPIDFPRNLAKSVTVE
jgi:glucosamine--fructose-6-phosphate aminotransferase (isomerizing)